MKKEEKTHKQCCKHSGNGHRRTQKSVAQPQEVQAGSFLCPMTHLCCRREAMVWLQRAPGKRRGKPPRARPPTKSWECGRIPRTHPQYLLAWQSQKAFPNLHPAKRTFASGPTNTSSLLREEMLEASYHQHNNQVIGTGDDEISKISSRDTTQNKYRNKEGCGSGNENWKTERVARRIWDYEGNIEKGVLVTTHTNCVRRITKMWKVQSSKKHTIQSEPDESHGLPFRTLWLMGQWPKKHYIR